MPQSGIVVALVHLKRGSLRVSAGQRVSVGEQIAECGNSGNSTQPHVHMQAMDSADLLRARGVPMVFRHFRESSRRGGKAELRDRWMPAESSIVEALPLPV